MPGNKTQWNISDQGNISSDSNIDIDKDIRQEGSNNLVKQYQNVTHYKWGQLSVKIKEYLLIKMLVRTNHWKNQQRI